MTSRFGRDGRFPGRCGLARERAAEIAIPGRSGFCRTLGARPSCGRSFSTASLVARVRTEAQESRADNTRPTFRLCPLKEYVSTLTSRAPPTMTTAASLFASALGAPQVDLV